MRKGSLDLKCVALRLHRIFHLQNCRTHFRSASPAALKSRWTSRRAVRDPRLNLSLRTYPISSVIHESSNILRRKADGQACRRTGRRAPCSRSHRKSPRKRRTGRTLLSFLHHSHSFSLPSAFEPWLCFPDHRTLSSPSPRRAPSSTRRAPSTPAPHSTSTSMMGTDPSSSSLS